MKTLALLVAAVIVAAIVLADLGYGAVFYFLEYVPGGDVTAHFALFALLSFAVCSAFAERAEGAWRRARVTAVLAVLAVLEEASQSAIPTRTFSLVDLSASLLGLATGAVGSAGLAAAKRRRR
jgi:VanZ family protein